MIPGKDLVPRGDDEETGVLGVRETEEDEFLDVDEMLSGS